METCTLSCTVEYDPELTDAESLATAMDTLLETSMSIPNVFEEYGNPRVGEFEVLIHPDVS